MRKCVVVAPVDEERGFIACLRVVGGLLFAIGGTDQEATIVASADGRNVHPCAAPETSGLRRGLEGDDGRLWVVGEYGVIASSADQGLTWTYATNKANGCLQGIERNSRGELAAFGEKGALLTSRAGKTWKAQKVGFKGTIFGLVPIDGADLLLRDDGKITRWDGKRGTTVTTGLSTPLTGLAEAKNGALWVVGDKGACATSADRGKTWRKVKLPVSATWEAIARVGDSLLIVGSGGHALISDDDGKTFKPIKTGTDEHLWSICAVDGGAFIGGEQGLILRFEDPKKPIWAKRKDTLAKRPGASDRYFDGDLKHFVAKQFSSFLGGGKSGSQLKDFEPVWGIKPPADLVALTSAIAGAKRELYEWRYENEGLPNPLKGKNVFEEIVLRDQKNYLGTGLFEAFAGLHFIGYQGNGDYYLLETFPKDETHRVIHFDHETFDFTPFADSANSLALLTSACAEQEARRLSVATWKKVTDYLAKRASPTWHFRTILGKAKLDYEGEPTAGARAYRCRWMIYLFRQDGVMAIEDMPDLFDARFNPPLTEALYEELKPRIHVPPTALMLLWRAFFFDDEVWLARMLAVAKKSKSRLVRDAGLLVEEFRAGRKKLGKIADIHKLKAQFLALDLDPSRAEQRQKEQKQAAKKASSAKKESAAKVEAATKRGDDIVELAWSSINDAGALEAVWKTVRAMPEMADPLRRLDWLAGDKWHRDNRILEHEQEEVIEIFLDKLSDRAATILIPLWVGQAVTNDKGWHRSVRLFRDVARLRPVDPRAATALRPLLSTGERYEFKRQSVLWVLGALKDRESVDAIVKLLDVAKPTQGNYYLDFGDAENLTKAALWALEEIGDKRAGAPIFDKLKKWGKTAHRMNIYLARALRTTGDETAIDTFLDLSQKLHQENNHDKGVTEMLWSAAVLGANASAAKKKAWAARLPPVSEYRSNINLARDLALRAFTGKAPPSLATSVAKALATQPGSSSWEREPVERSLRAMALAPELPANLALPFTEREDPVFRRLAHAVTKAPAVGKVDLFALDDTSDEDLERMLGDEQLLFRSRVVDAIVARKRTKLKPAIVTRIRQVVTRCPTEERDLSPESEYALYWAIKGLISLGLDAESRAVFVELLRHPNRNVKDPVLRHAPNDPALAPGMKHVLDENWAWQANAARAWLKKNKSKS